MKAGATRIGAGIAFCALAIAGTPTAGADPNASLPPLASTGGGPLIGGGDPDAQYRISLQLSNLGNPDVQESDGADAAAFITASAASTNPRLASAFAPLQRALSCQRDTSLGARAYRRNDGQWGGAVLVIAKSAAPDIDALTGCVKSAWPAPAARGPTSMCNAGWTYPTSGDNHHYILLAGTAADFCGPRNDNYANYATRWP